ncbi:MAG: hypothetical protein IJ538_02180 [Clostridia bacterium]|nr:hypothetical protein [Clostridia bacterium]
MKLNSNEFVEYNDQFNYYNLITLIDKNYKLVFNYKKKLFMILNSANNNEICYTFSNFKVNLINILQKTRVEHSTKIFDEIENINNLVIEKNIKNNTLSIKDKLNDLYKTSSRI